MNLSGYFIYFVAFVLLSSCSQESVDSKTSGMHHTKQLLQKMSDERTNSEKNDDLKSFLKHYHTDAISMPEYQPTLKGLNEIEVFYTAIFKKQLIKNFERKTNEVIELGKTIIEIGTFKKEYTELNVDTVITQNGKYLNVWELMADGNYKLKGEAFGFFHPVKNPETLMVELINAPTKQSETLVEQTPFELKAYNALMEKGVRTRDGVLRSEFFTNDGSFMPFADTTVTGMDKIKPYLLEYSSRGKVKIDSISIDTFHAEYFDDYVLEYAMFFVKWTVPQLSGTTKGKGIRIWKRQEDKSLKLYREIGTHDHIRNNQ